MATKGGPKPLCKYGATCYRKNPQHQQQFRHEKRKADDEDEELPTKKIKVQQKEKAKGPMDKFFGQKKPTSEHDRSSDDEPRLKKSTSEHDISSDDEPEDNSGAEAGPACGYVRQESDDEKVSNSDLSEEEDAPASPEDVRDNIKQKFLVEMPEDFYSFWKFCQSINSKCPQDALFDTLGFKLVGPFDILAGRHKGIVKNRHNRKPNYLQHWRYYYDPPEFLTVISGDKKSQFHIGYFRDDPADPPVFVASNSAKQNGNISSRGDNLFAAIRYFMEEKIKSGDLSSDGKKKLQKLSESLSEWAKAKDFTLDLRTKKMKERDKKVVCKSFHGAGIVVPVDKNDVGYREVPESPGDLKRMFKKIVESKTEEERIKNLDPVQEIITFIQFANDECDYGEGLELGLDLFTYGGQVFHSMILHLLPLAYQLLGRQEYGKIVEAHLRHRNHDSDLSELD